MSNNLQKIKEKITPILKEHGVSYCAVFGSFARGEEKDNSDIDLLVRFTEPVGLFDFVGLEMELSDILGKKVDLVTEKAIHPLLKDNIYKNLQKIYE